MRIDKTMYDYEPAYREGYDDGYDDGYKAAADMYLAECKQLRDCLRAIIGDGEAPEHAMNDGRSR